jgi:hypothetical protein
VILSYGRDIYEIDALPVVIHKDIFLVVPISVHHLFYC